MNCPYCGTQVQNGWYFCPKCSRKIIINNNVESSIQNNLNNDDNTHMSSEQTKYISVTSNKSKLIATKLCILGIIINLTLGIIMEITNFHYPLLFFAGLHRFYVGKIWSGIFYTFTVGFFFIGSIIDLVKLLLGQFSDNVGQPLRR